MAIEASYSFVLWAVPRFRRAGSYPIEPRQAPDAVEHAEKNPPAREEAVEPEQREAGARLSTVF